MTGMTYREFQQALLDYDEFEFTYRNELYTLYKEEKKDGIRLLLWTESGECLYDRTIQENDSQFITDFLNAQILPDKNSISSAEKDIRIEWCA